MTLENGRYDKIQVDKRCSWFQLSATHLVKDY